MDFVDFGLFYFDMSSAYSDSEVVDFALFELAFFNVEVQIMVPKDGEHFSDQSSMSFTVLFLGFIRLLFHVDRYVIHVYHEPPLCDLLLEYGVHHGLERCR